MGIWYVDPYLLRHELLNALKAGNEQWQALLHEKHVAEWNREHRLEQKRADLHAWQVLLTRAVIELGHIQQPLHEAFNQFYEEMHSASDLAELQRVEWALFAHYAALFRTDRQWAPNLAFNRLLSYIHIHLQDSLTVQQIAESLQLSPSYLEQLMDEMRGMPVMAYIRQLRIERAKLDLSNTKMTMADIARKFSFYDQSHFTRTFKQLVGMTPSQYRTLHDHTTK